MSPNPLAMAPTNVQTAAVQGSPVGNNNGITNQQRTKQKLSNGGSSPRHRKNKNTRERSTPSPKQRGSPKPKSTNVPSTSRRNYTPPPRFQKPATGQFKNGAFVDITSGSCNTNMNNNFSSIANFSGEGSSSDESLNDSKKPFAGAKFHSEAPGPETLPMPPSSWLAGCTKKPTAVSISNKDHKNDYHQLATELKCMLKVTL